MWNTADLESVSAKFFDYGAGLAPNVHPEIVWRPGSSGDPGLRIRVHDGDLRLDGLAFETNRFVDPEADMLIVDGDLTIDGDLVVDQFDVGTPGYLVVTGVLKARNLLLASQFELMVRGDVSVAGVFLCREAAGGGVTCLGNVRAPVTVVEDYPFKAAGLTGTLLARERPGEGEPTGVTIAETSAARVVGVEEDETAGRFWLLTVPDGAAQEETETDEELAAWSVLSPAALAAYDRADGTLPLEAVMREHGVGAFRTGLVGTV